MEEFLEAALVLPPTLASRCRWHGAEQQEEGACSERPAKATGAVAEHSLPLWPAPRWFAALLRRGPVCHLLRRSTSDQYREHSSGLKELQETKPFYAKSVLFSCSVVPTFSIIAGSHCQGY